MDDPVESVDKKEMPERAMTIRKRIFRACLIFAAIGMMIPLIACQKEPAEPEPPPYLIKAGETTMTALDFQRAFEVNKTAYDYDDLKNPEFLKSAKLQFLKQMTERLPVLERAREMNVTVSPKRLEEEIATLQQGYPDGEFEIVLLESAISYAAWVEELRIRLLMEKLVQLDLTANVVVSEEDIERYRRAYIAERVKTGKEGAAKAVPENLDERIVKYLRHKRTEEGYEAWLAGLQERYPIDINETEWEKIIQDKKE